MIRLFWHFFKNKYMIELPKHLVVLHLLDPWIFDIPAVKYLQGRKNGKECEKNCLPTVL